jgi:uncharacterized protein YybS (DUF2232 family)
VLVAITVTLASAAGYVPIVGMLVSILAPTPILLGALRYGPKIGVLVLVLSTVALALLRDLQYSLLFLAEYGVMAMVMAEALRRQQSFEKTLILASGATVVVSSLVMGILLWSAQLDLGIVLQHLEENLRRTLHPYVSDGDGGAEAQLLPYIQEALHFLVRVLPALLVMSAATGAVVNYSVVRGLWHHFGGSPLFPETSLARWRAPDACVWVLIASGIFGFLPVPLLPTVGLNILLLVSLLYLAQGLGIIVFYLHKGSVPVMWRAVVYLFLIVQPLLLLGVTAFGLFDLWGDFRRLHQKREDLS